MSKQRLDICIITYKREKQLKRLLLSILETHDLPALNAEIIVVDNDKAQSAKLTVGSLNKDYPSMISYYVENEKGYAKARNKCFEVCRSDLVVFVDDDEWVTEKWLDSLLNTKHTYGADIVVGPVLSVFPENTPDWIIQGRFFDRDRHPTGQSLEFGYSGNVLMDTNKIIREELYFDLQFGNNGGEDHELFTRLFKTGHLIIWSDKSIVYEEILGEKLHPKWILKRAFRVGRTFSQVLLMDKSVFHQFLWYLKKSAFFLLSLLLFPWYLIRGKGHGIRMLSRAFTNLGGISTMLDKIRTGGGI